MTRTVRRTASAGDDAGAGRRLHAGCPFRGGTGSGIGDPSRPGTGRCAGDAGFTLLEIVVALVVLGILLVTLTRGVQFGLAAFDRQDRMIATGSRLEAVDRTLRRLIVQLDPGTSSDGNTVAGGRHALAFRAPLPMGRGTSGAGAVADLRLSVDDAHNLVLAWLPYRHVLRSGPVLVPHLETLIGGVDRIDLDYWGNGAWQDQWRHPRPPALIRIRIVFLDGDSRHWPDIVEAPRRDQAD